MRAFLDRSVLIDALQNSHPDHHARARGLMESVGAGEVELHISSTEFLESSYVLSKTYGIARTILAETFLNLLSHPNIMSDERGILIRTDHLWERESPLSFADCYHLVLAESLGLDGIYAFDRKMGRYPPGERLEP